MQVNNKIKLFFPLFLLISSLNAFSAVDLVNVAKQSVKSKTTDLTKNISLKDILNLNYQKMIEANIINIPGFIGLGVQCDIDKNFVWLDPCKLIKPASTKFSFSLGACQVQVGLSTQCIYDFYHKMCKNYMKKALKTPAKEVRSSTKKLKNISNTIIKKITWKEKCALLDSQKRSQAIKNPNGVPLSEIETKYIQPEVVYKYALPATGNNGIFDSSLNDWADCIFDNADKNNPQKVLKICSNIKNSKLPKTYHEVSNAITDGVIAGAKEIDVTNDDFKNLLLMQKVNAQKCANANDPASCENKNWNNGFNTSIGVINPKDAYNKKLDEIEKKNALLMKYVDKAFRKDKEMVFISQDFIDSLPAKNRKKYQRQAERIMYQKVLNNIYWKNITAIEEAQTSILYDAMKIQASQFYPQKAIAEIDSFVKAFASSSSKQ